MTEKPLTAVFSGVSGSPRSFLERLGAPCLREFGEKFTIAIHILAAAKYFGETKKVTSDLLAASIGSNPVIIREIMSDLKNAGLIETKRGPGGITITRPLDKITFLDVYNAVEKNKDELFHFHENPNPQCPVGKNIHEALDQKLMHIQHDLEESLRLFRKCLCFPEGLSP